MLSPRNNRFGIPGVISVIALVFAMLGGAYATSDNSGGGKATASAKAKKGPPGPRGPKGKPGPAGPQGPAGPAGAKGEAGTAGANGTNGSNGSSGVSVTSTSLPEGDPNCEFGGSKFASASPSPAYACNGEPGQEGPEGNPWTVGGTLPPGATETGIWGTTLIHNTSSGVFPISIPIPLESAPEPIFVPGNQESKPGCPGRGGGTFAEGYEPTTPEADPGKLCIYAMGNENVTNHQFNSFVYQAFFETFETSEVNKATPVGTFLKVFCSGPCNLWGSWAVTAGP